MTHQEMNRFDDHLSETRTFLTKLMLLAETMPNLKSFGNLKKHEWLAFLRKKKCALQNLVGTASLFHIAVSSIVTDLQCTAGRLKKKQARGKSYLRSRQAKD